MTEKEFFLRLCLSVFLGLLIGLERQITGHSGGIRTHLLVCLGASLFALFPPLVSAPDNVRMGGQVVTGVGFLCSAIIFKGDGRVRGLNTAATVWCTASIGLLCSTGNWKVASLGTAVLLACNLLLRPLGNKVPALVQNQDEGSEYRLTATCLEQAELAVRAALLRQTQNHKSLLLTQLESADVLGDKVEIAAEYQCTGRHREEKLERTVAEISLLEGVVSAGWSRLDE